MAVMRFDPFRDFDRLTEQIFGGVRGMRVLPMEAYRRGGQFFVHLDLPGVSPDDVNITLERNVVAIRAERRSPRMEGDEVLIDERPRGSFTRQLFLGENLDADRLNASYDKGVLTLTIPVSEQAKPRRVEISAESGQQPQPVGTSTGQPMSEQSAS
jgi:HSP20 family protein